MKKILLILALLLIPSIASAADITTTACPGAGCVDFIANQGATAQIQVNGTFSGTITFEGTVDGTTFVAISCLASTQTTATTLASTTTTTGLFKCDVRGIKTFRVVFTSFVSGTANVYVAIVPL